MGGSSAGKALGILQLCRIQEFAAVLALVTPCLGVTTMRTDASYIAIGQKTTTGLTIQLLDGLFLHEPGSIYVFEKPLDYFCLPGCGSTTELVKGYAKPIIDVLVDFMETRAQLGRSYPLFQSLCLGGCPVFIGTTDIEGFVASKPAGSGKDICRQDLNEIAKVGNIVDVRQGAGNESSFHGGATIRMQKSAVKRTSSLIMNQTTVHSSSKAYTAVNAELITKAPDPAIQSEIDSWIYG
jgi:hypothetical protein